MSANKNGYVLVPIEVDEVTDTEPSTPQVRRQSSQNGNEDGDEKAKLRRTPSQRMVAKIKTQLRPKTLLKIPTPDEVPDIKDSIGSPMFESAPHTGADGLSFNTAMYKNWQRYESKQTRLNTHLLTNIQNGEDEMVKKLLIMGANPNAVCRLNRISAINLAALMGFKDIMFELLKHDACVDFEDNHGQNILHYLAFAENIECLEEIINYSNETSSKIIGTIINKRAIANPDYPDFSKLFSDNLEHNCDEIQEFIPLFERGSTPLHVACQHANIKICKLLIENGASTEIEDERECLPMNVIGEAFLNTGDEEQLVQEELSCFLETLTFLINSNVEYNDCVHNKCHIPLLPLNTAIELQHLDSVALLLSRGANPLALNASGETAIHLGITKRDEGIVKILVEFCVKNNQDINVKNALGYTPFQMAVDLQWCPGIYILLEAGADVTETAHNGDSVLHIASAAGNLELVRELLGIADTQKVLELRNEAFETPLFCAARSGSLDCVQALVDAGADIFVELPFGRTLLHRAAEYGFCSILHHLVSMTEGGKDKEWLNKRDTFCDSGRTALHIAVSRNQLPCVRTLLEAGCDIRIKTTELPHKCSNALHIAAEYGFDRILEVILEHDPDILNDLNGNNWKALPLAANSGRRKCVQILLQHGADLSEHYRHEQCRCLTAFDLLMYNISRPTEFLEEVFDSCVTKNEYGVNDPNCTVHVNHTVLMPQQSPKQVMKVLKAVLNTGNRFDQKRLLLHPVVESYLILKWKALSPIFYAMVFLYFLYVLGLTTIIFTLYCFDGYENFTPYAEDVLLGASYMVMFALSITAFQEILHAIENFGKYFFAIETWVKWISFILSGIIAFREITRMPHEPWIRHVLAVSILFTWTELMFLLSRFPSWGYYVLMFIKVARNVGKVLLTFSFLIIGFALSFLIEFRTNSPFSNPLEALVKTFVMMTSEYDYMDLFSNDDGEMDADLMVRLIIGRIVFMAFVVLVSIVLMNLMVGLAVSDINALEIKGQMQRLEKQVDFLSALSFARFEAQNDQSCLKRQNSLTFYPGKPAKNLFGTQIIPLDILEKLRDIADLTEKEPELTVKCLSDRIELIYKSVSNKLDRILLNKEKFFQKQELKEKPKKKLLKHLQNIIKKNESKSLNPSTCELSTTDKELPLITVTDTQRLDNIEKKLHYFEDILKKIEIKIN